MGKKTKEENFKTKKKEFRRSIIEKLEAALADLKNELNEKKYSAAIKKAGKFLSGALLVKMKKEKKKKKEKPDTDFSENLAL